jgi:hypothetical protein
MKLYSGKHPQKSHGQSIIATVVLTVAANIFIQNGMSKNKKRWEIL